MVNGEWRMMDRGWMMDDGWWTIEDSIVFRGRPTWQERGVYAAILPYLDCIVTADVLATALREKVIRFWEK
jgi:hypothetical protein